MNFSRRKRAAACLLLIDLLEECKEVESGQGNAIASGDSHSGAYKEMFRMNCETVEEILTAIGPVITKTA